MNGLCLLLFATIPQVYDPPRDDVTCIEVNTVAAVWPFEELIFWDYDRYLDEWSIRDTRMDLYQWRFCGSRPEVWIWDKGEGTLNHRIVRAKSIMFTVTPLAVEATHRWMFPNQERTGLSGPEVQGDP